MTRHAALTKVVDRGSILLIVYAAFSVGMAEHIWSSVQPWRVVAVAAVSAVVLAAVLAFTWITGRLTRLDRADAIVLLFCGSKKKSLASGLPMALVLFPRRQRGLDHVAADAVSPDPAVRLRGDRHPAWPRGGDGSQFRLTSIGWVASSDSGNGWRRNTRDHKSTRCSTSTSEGNADNTIQSSRSISPSSWPMVQPE